MNWDLEMAHILPPPPRDEDWLMTVESFVAPGTSVLSHSLGPYD